MALTSHPIHSSLDSAIHQGNRGRPHFRSLTYESCNGGHRGKAVKRNALAAIAKTLAADLPASTARGPNVFMRPVRPLLRGLCLEDSSFDSESYYVWVFLWPMYVSTKTIVLNIGTRIRRVAGGDRWNASDVSSELVTAIEQQAEPFLYRFKAPEDVRAAVERLGIGRDLYAIQAIAFSYIKLGDTGLALAALKQLGDSVDKQIVWQRNIAKRALDLQQVLSRSPQEARSMLDGYEVENVEALGLSDV